MRLRPNSAIVATISARILAVKEIVRWTAGLAAGTLVLCASSNETGAQAPRLALRVAKRAAEVTRTIGRFLAEYAAERVIDRMVGVGAEQSDSISAIRGELRALARSSTVERSLLLRQDSILGALRDDLLIVMTRRPTQSEAAAISGRSTASLRELQNVLTDHERRLGRLESAVDSLRAVLQEGILIMPSAMPQAREATVTELATREVDQLSIALVGVFPMSTASTQLGRSVRALRVSVRLTNRDSSRETLVAFNADGEHGSYNVTSRPDGVWGDCGMGKGLRTTVTDSNGDSWVVTSITGASIVGVGCAGRVHDPSDIAALLRKQEELQGRALPQGARYAYGAATSIGPGSTTSAVLEIVPERTSSVRALPEWIALAGEIVIGQRPREGSPAMYRLHSVSFERIEFSGTR